VSRREDARLGMCLVLTVIVCGGLAMAALLQALGHTAVSPPSASTSWVRGLLPEGWKFFTRDPREEGLYLRVAAGGDGWMDGPARARLRDTSSGYGERPGQ
jgi:hypothetical protein